MSEHAHPPASHAHKWHFNPDEPLSAQTIARLENPARQQTFNPSKWLPALGPLSSKSVADVACGTGAFCGPLLKAVGPGGKVYGIDIDPRMVAHTKARFEKEAAFAPVLSTRENIPLPNACLDAAVLISTLHDLDGDATLREIRRLLKAGARLVVVDWKKIRQEGGPAYEIRKSEPEARAMLEALGFACSVFEVSDSAWGIRAEKTAD
ncbi:Ubiquinone/menaquinone biosynthesis C-methyltransferase UbiE [uncultured archaeon]|nr:Ubiquinone/menaquinone biosynthesis C-methyltransferase UbiE [uncultured archaeon]